MSRTRHVSTHTCTIHVHACPCMHTRSIHVHSCTCTTYVPHSDRKRNRYWILPSRPHPNPAKYCLSGLTHSSILPSTLHFDLNVDRSLIKSLQFLKLKLEIERFSIMKREANNWIFLETKKKYRKLESWMSKKTEVETKHATHHRTAKYLYFAFKESSHTKI